MTLNSGNQGKSPQVVKRSWLKRNSLVLVMFLLVLGITIGLFVFRNEIAKLGNYGYLGTFLISLFTNATIILPMPSILMIIPLGATFNPLYIGLVAGVGGSIGEMTAYVAGYSGRNLWQDNPNYLRAEAWLKKWGMIIVFIFSVSPMPLDLMGLAAGNLRLPVWKFFLPCWPGKTIKYIVMAYIGYWGWEAFNRNDSLKTSLLVLVIAAVSVAILLILALVIESHTWHRTTRKH